MAVSEYFMGLYGHGLNKLSRATTKYYRSAAELYKDKHYHTVLPFGKTFS